MATWNGDIAKMTIPTPFAVGDVNVFLVKGDALTLIDAGVKTEEAWDAFTIQLSQLGYTPDDIEQVVLTHHHPDHVGLLDWLPDKLSIYGHKYCAPFLNRDKEFFEAHNQFYFNLFNEFGLQGDFEKMLKQWKSPLKFSSARPLTHTVEEGDSIEGFGEWQILETPGHAQSHLSFYRKKDSTILSGDHVLAKISSNPLLEPPLLKYDQRPKPQLQYNDSLRRLFDFDIKIAYTGHGVEVKDIHSLIDRRLQRQHDRAMQVREMITQQSLTTFEICKKLFPSVYQKELGLTLSETTAQIDYLLSINAVSKQLDDHGVAYFSAV